MSDFQQGPEWWQASDGKWYSPERHPDYQPPMQSLVAPPMTPTVAAEQPSTVVPGTPPLRPYNELHPVTYRGGWIGLFAGENQLKALERAIPRLNAANLRVVAAVEDRWSVWKRIGVLLLLLVTLGFVGKVPNVLLITEPTV